MEYEFWDVGEESDSRPPNLGLRSSAKVLQAIVIFKGKIHAYHADLIDAFVKDSSKLQYCTIVYRISLPVGVKEEFEKYTGYRLTQPPKIHI
jgi:hypothetical protein